MQKINLGSSIGQKVFRNRTGRGVLQCPNVSTSLSPTCSSSTAIQHCHKGKDTDATALAFLVPPGVRNSLFILLFWLSSCVMLQGNFLASLLVGHRFHHSREENGPSSSKENSLSPADCLCWGVQLSMVSTVAERISPYWYHLGSIKLTFFIWRIQVQTSSYFWLTLP